VLYADGGNGSDDSALLMDGIGHVLAAHDRRRIVARLKAGRDARPRPSPMHAPRVGDYLMATGAMGEAASKLTPRRRLRFDAPSSLCAVGSRWRKRRRSSRKRLGARGRQSLLIASCAERSIRLPSRGGSLTRASGMRLSARWPHDVSARSHPLVYEQRTHTLSTAPRKRAGRARGSIRRARERFAKREVRPGPLPQDSCRATVAA
jgi:hypothetical protein